MPLSPVISRHILPVALKLLYASLRISITPPLRDIPLPDEGTMFAFWHGKMITGWLLARTIFPSKKITAVVSMSEDGRALADTLQQCGFSLIRGSSSKGGEEVKSAMKGVLQKSGIVVFTPDGPRGPINQFKYGALRLASTNHSALVFAEICYASKWILNSWDQFEIPKPFSKTTVKLHLLELPLFLSEVELQTYTTTLSERLSHA
ncbi:MAG: DUF374 domain-containing protein [Chlorobium sp.]|nr:MAG: DUF374 domain-containing protein [Chlorobium sp.]